MLGSNSSTHHDATARDLVHTRIIKLRKDLTVQGALEQLRKCNVPDDSILYLYIVDEEDRLVGVVPTRKLLRASHDRRLFQLAVTKIFAITENASVPEVYQMFMERRYLALPVVDAEHRLIGVVDVKSFAEHMGDISERRTTDEVFDLIGFRLSQLRNASVFQAWRYRFPWLLATLASGIIGAFLAGMFEQTLERSIVLAFFLTLVLALGESVSIQAMTLTIQRLKHVQPSLFQYVKSITRDMVTAALLAVSSAVITGAVALLWRRSIPPTAVIALTIFCSILAASFLGHTIPFVLHALRLDPKVAAGPLVLALADVCTLLIYFGLGTVIL